MQTINLKGGVITLEASRKELEVLEVIIRAGHNTDPVFRHASDEEKKYSFNCLFFIG